LVFLLLLGGVLVSFGPLSLTLSVLLLPEDIVELDGFAGGESGVFERVEEWDRRMEQLWDI
jgi:hypothetical protein